MDEIKVTDTKLFVLGFSVISSIIELKCVYFICGKGKNIDS